jgi:GDP-L-fucose synthase
MLLRKKNQPLSRVAIKMDQNAKIPKMLIAGATGFIGRNLLEYFVSKKNFEVIGLYHLRPPYEISGVRWMQADLTRKEDVFRVLSGVDVLIQAAATTSGVKDIVTRPHIHVADNAVMNSLLFSAAHELKVGHVVFFSCTVMLQSSDDAQTETSFNANVEIHARYFGAGWTKFYLERIAEFYSRLGKTRFTIVRHSNVYGPHDKFDLERSHVFGATVFKVMTEAEKIIVWGTGDETRDLLYVGDLVRFVELALAAQPHAYGLYNCGTGVPVQIKDLVARIVRASGRNLSIEHDVTAPTIPTNVHLDCTKALQELGWKPNTCLDQGISYTIDWWRRNSGEREQKS